MGTTERSSPTDVNDATIPLQILADPEMLN